MLIVFSAMKSSDAYKIALARAKADPRVEEAIGTPIKAGLFVSGSTKEEGEWKYSKLVVKIADTGEKIDLGGETDSE